MHKVTYIIADSKGWGRGDYGLLSDNTLDKWIYITDREELFDVIKTESPRYIFFLHWNWRVPEEILSSFECVCFHMTDVPYGRGGSPLQNLILNGKEETVVSALRMVEELDAGPVYIKQRMLLDGRAEDIYKRATSICIGIMQWMIQEEPIPKPQFGDPFIFTRRKPNQSRLPFYTDSKLVYDHIRMLDAPGYPLAFLDYGELRIYFQNAQLLNGEVVAQVKISNRKDN